MSAGKVMGTSDRIVGIRKGPDLGPGVIAVSIGGDMTAGSIVCIYRGSKEHAVEALTMALIAMRRMAEEFGDDEPDPDAMLDEPCGKPN